MSANERADVGARRAAALPRCALELASAAVMQPYGLPTPVVITLDRRPDRWAMAQRTLGERGITNPLRSPAVDGATLSAGQLTALLEDPSATERPLDQYLQLTRPAVGCFLSHLSIWQAFLDSGAPHVLILEDDARPAPGYTPARAQAVLAALPDDTDILLLGGTIMDGLAEPTADPGLTRVYYYNGTYAYLLTRKGCAALLPSLLPLRTHIDNQISLDLVARRDALHVYAVEPRLFEHDFDVWSDVYVPVTDTGRADRTLARVFEDARSRLTQQGARLLPRHQA